jgi:hypothetical protein
VARPARDFRAIDQIELALQVSDIGDAAGPFHSAQAEILMDRRRKLGSNSRW